MSGAALAVRPQPHVDAEHVAVGGDVVERGDDAPAEAVEILAVGDDARARGLAFLGIDEHEVDVGRHVELAAAQLAHADHDELLRRAAVRADRRAVHRVEVARMHARWPRAARGPPAWSSLRRLRAGARGR